MKSYVPLHYVPVEDDGFHIQINGQAGNHTLRLVVDSGASRTVFDNNRIGGISNSPLKLAPEIQAHGLGQEIQSFLLHINCFKIADQTIDNYTSILMDLNPLNQLFRTIHAPEIHGIIGGDLLVALKAIINYKKTTIKLAGKRYSLRKLNFDDGSFHLLLQINLQNQPANMLLDTGASKTVFDLNCMKLFHDFKPSDLIPNEKPSAGIHVETTEHCTAKLGNISFGYLAIPEKDFLLLDLANINFTYSLLNLPPIDGIFGNDLLGQLQAVINYKKKTLRLKGQPNEKPD